MGKVSHVYSKKHNSFIHFASPALILLFSIFLKWSTSLNSFSGKGVEPMHGDFEAQRHWIEITSNLPVNQWYTYKTEYWGLDYPPLTAYHSLLLSKFSSNKTNFELDKSRGLETNQVILFMRLTSIFSDLILYSVSLLVFSVYFVTKFDKNMFLILSLSQPSLILIDHGHFQYNSVMLGLTVFSIIFLRDNHLLLGSISFCLALCFKQMSLYYALPIFFFLLGKCFQLTFYNGVWTLVKIGSTVILTFSMIFSPFLLSFNDLVIVIKRIFPIARGLYEDKVGNFWCASNVLIKWRSLFEMQNLVYISLGATLISVIPSCLHLFFKPTSRNLIYAIVNSALGFFLFSFQVHEKSILLPLLPATLMIMEESFVGVLFNNVAMFSMFPLLKKDGLVIPFFALFSLWNIFVTFLPTNKNNNLIKRVVTLISALSISTIFILEMFFAPPAHLPDLFVVLNAIISFIHFILFLFYFNIRQIFPQLGCDHHLKANRVAGKYDRKKTN